MTRIIAGAAKGRRLEIPSQGTRPTSDKVRGAIFSRLLGWGAVEDAHVLDLFAGSGALALEALSTGAADAVAVEKSPAASAIVRKNAQSCGFQDVLTVATSDVTDYLTRTRPTREGLDLVFIDPPYSCTEQEVSGVLEALLPHLHVDATIVLERDGRSPEPTIPPELTVLSGKRWGDTAAWYLGLAASEA